MYNICILYYNVSTAKKFNQRQLNTILPKAPILSGIRLQGDKY